MHGVASPDHGSSLLLGQVGSGPRAILSIRACPPHLPLCAQHGAAVGGEDSLTSCQVLAAAAAAAAGPRRAQAIHPSSSSPHPPCPLLVAPATSHTPSPASSRRASWPAVQSSSCPALQLPSRSATSHTPGPTRARRATTAIPLVLTRLRCRSGLPVGFSKNGFFTLFHEKQRHEELLRVNTRVLCSDLTLTAVRPPIRSQALRSGRR